MKIDVSSEISREIEPDERLLWSGTPCQGVFPRFVELWLLAAGSLIGVALLSIGIGLITLEGRYQGLIPCGIGISVIAAFAGYNLIGSPRFRSRACYAITDHRALLIYRWWGRRIVRSISLDAIQNVRVIKERLEFGNVAIDARRHGMEHFETRGLPFLPHEPVFELIPDAASVGELLEEARKTPKSPLKPMRHNV